MSADLGGTVYVMNESVLRHDGTGVKALVRGGTARRSAGL
jgi:hypothetical protein